MTTPLRPSPGEVLLTQLRDHLDQELAVHRQLFTLAEDKRRAVIAADGRTLSELVTRELQPIEDANRLRQVRERLLKTAALLWSIAPTAVSLTALAQRASDQLKADLLRRGHELRNVLERLREANDRNQVLIRQGLNVVRDLVSTLTGSPAPAAYDRRGLNPYTTGGGGGLLDLRG